MSWQRSSGTGSFGVNVGAKAKMRGIGRSAVQAFVRLAYGKLSKLSLAEWTVHSSLQPGLLSLELAFISLSLSLSVSLLRTKRYIIQVQLRQKRSC